MTEDRTPLISSPDSDTDTLTEMTYKTRSQRSRYEFPFTPRKKRVGRITLFEAVRRVFISLEGSIFLVIEVSELFAGS